jgi:hypothetical protein
MLSAAGNYIAQAHSWSTLIACAHRSHREYLPQFVVISKDHVAASALLDSP